MRQRLGWRWDWGVGCRQGSRGTGMEISGSSWLVSVWDCLLVDKWGSLSAERLIDCYKWSWGFVRLSQCENKHPKIISPPHFSFDLETILEVLRSISRRSASPASSAHGWAVSSSLTELFPASARGGMHLLVLGEGSRAELWSNMRCAGLCCPNNHGEALQGRTARNGWRGASGLLPDPSFFTGEVKLPSIQLALPWIDLSRKADPTNGSWQARAGELLGLIQVFLHDFCSCLNAPGHMGRLQEEQMTLEHSVVATTTWKPRSQGSLGAFIFLCFTPSVPSLNQIKLYHYPVGWSTEKFLQSEKSVCWWGKGNVATLVYLGEKAMHKRGLSLCFPGWFRLAGCGSQGNLIHQLFT